MQVKIILHEVLLACRWLLTCASVRSFTFISSKTDFGVAPGRNCNRKGIKLSLRNQQLAEAGVSTPFQKKKKRETNKSL
jgi:hypothetical protein